MINHLSGVCLFLSCRVDVMSSKSLKKVGKVAHYFVRIGVAVIDLSYDLSVGDKIMFQGSTTAY